MDTLMSDPKKRTMTMEEINALRNGHWILYFWLDLSEWEK